MREIKLREVKGLLKNSVLLKALTLALVKSHGPPLIMIASQYPAILFLASYIQPASLQLALFGDFCMPHGVSGNTIHGFSASWGVGGDLQYKD